MAALTVTGYDSGGTGHSLTQLLSFSWECSKSCPYASLELSALDVPGANWFHRLEVSLNGSQLFSGRMDTQVWEQTVSGSLCRLTARSATAALVDNEAAPVAYQNYSLDQLLFDHAYPYGVTGSTLSGGTLSQILCTKGMSHWDFLQFYCRLLLGYLPWVNEEGILMGRQETGEGISFVQGDYESFTLSLDRTGLISRLYVLDSTGQYRPITNNFAQALLGEKTEYYAPPGRWSQNLTQAAGNRFREGQLDYLTGKLVLPGLHRYRLGQRVDFSGDGIAFSGMELSGIALFGDSGGFHTTLTLSDPAAGNI